MFIDLKMTPVNIIVIFVKKNEIQDIGFTIVKIVVILLIPNVFLENTQITSLEVLTHLIATYTLLLSLRKLKLMMTHHDTCNSSYKYFIYQRVQCKFKMRQFCALKG